MIKYKIIEVDEPNHSIVVRYYTDKITEEMLATDVLDGVIRRGRTDYNISLPYPTPIGEELHKLISASAPVDWLNTQEAVIAPEIDTSLSNITNLINQENVVETTAGTSTTQAVTASSEVQTEQIKAIVQQVLTEMSGTSV